MTVTNYYEQDSYNQMLADVAGDEPFELVEPPPSGLTVGPMIQEPVGEAATPAAETNETPKWLEEAEAALSASQQATEKPDEAMDVQEPKITTDVSEEDAAWMQEAAEMNAEAELVAELTADRPMTDELAQLGEQPVERAPQPVPDSVAQVEEEPAAEEEDPEAQQEAGQVNAAARELLRSHLAEYMAKQGSAAATYEGWIGELHPENVDADGWIDPRLCLDGSEHRQIWMARAMTTSDEVAAPTSDDHGPEGEDADEGTTTSCPAEDVVGGLFNSMTAGTTLGFAAMHGALGCGVEGLKAAKDKVAANEGQQHMGVHSPLHCMLRMMQGSLEAMDMCALGAERVTSHGLAAAGGASCGMLTRSGRRAERTHHRLRSTHNALRWRNGPGERAWGAIKPVAVVC